MEEQDIKRIFSVQGNTQTYLIPLEQEVVPEEGDPYREDYYPDANAEVTVRLVSRFSRYTFTPTVDGNLLTFTDKGTLPANCYNVEVIVKNPDGSQYRSNWENQIVVKRDNESVLEEWDEFKTQAVKARAAVFFFAKGGKGDAATIVVGTVTTGAAGSRASVANSATSNAAILNFTIPKGDPGDYTKPAGGIPSTDMTEAVQTSLGLADTSLQEITDTAFEDIFNDW